MTTHLSMKNGVLESGHVSFLRTMQRWTCNAVLFTALLCCLVSIGQAQEAGGSNARDQAISESAKSLDLFVLDSRGKPVTSAEVEFRGGPKGTAEQFPVGEFIKQGTYGTFVKPNKFGRVVYMATARNSSFSISIKAKGYGPYHAQYDTKNWTADPTKQLKAELEDGWSIGGRIVDEEGRPIEGVVVRPSIEYKKAPGMTYQLGVGERRRTNKNGVWRLHIVPDSESSLSVGINHPDFKPHRESLSRHQFEIKGNDPEFKNITLSRGIVVSGNVTDTNGKPVQGALIRSKFVNDIRSARTDSNGEYKLSGCEVGTTRIVVSAPGKATDMKEVDLTAKPEPVNFEMQPGGHVRIVVQDKKGNPIPRARIFYQNWRGRADYFAFDFKDQYADENGVWEWNEAPLDPFDVDVCRPGGMQLSNQRIVARAEEYVFSPPPALKISGKVINAETKKPINAFRVTPGTFFPNGPHPLNRDAFAGAQGKYEVTRMDGYGSYFVRIDAPGYQAKDSRKINPDEGTITIDFELQPAKVIETTLLTPTGDPAARAYAAVGIPGTRIRIENGAFDRINTDCLVHESEKQGRIHWTLQDLDTQLVVLHETGYAYIESRNGPIPEKITLTPWGRIKGTYQVGKTRLPNVLMDVNSSQINSFDRDRARIDTSLHTRTGPDGAFHFERVFPGRSMISRYVSFIWNEGAKEMVSQARIPLHVDAGETASITIGGSGTAITGQLQAPDDLKEKPRWRLVRLELKPIAGRPDEPPIPDSAKGDPILLQEWYEQWAQTEAGKKYLLDLQSFQDHQNAQTQFSATCDADGNFRFDDVPPGEYELTDWGFSELPVRAPSKKVVIPNGKSDVIKLGKLQTELKGM